MVLVKPDFSYAVERVHVSALSSIDNIIVAPDLWYSLATKFKGRAINSVGQRSSGQADITTGIVVFQMLRVHSRKCRAARIRWRYISSASKHTC